MQPEHPLKFGFCQPSCLKLRSRQPTLCGRCQPSSDHPCSSKTQPATVFFLFTSLPLTVGVPQLCGFGILQGIPCPAKATPKGFSLALGEAVKESLDISIGFLLEGLHLFFQAQVCIIFWQFQNGTGPFQNAWPFCKALPFCRALPLCRAGLCLLCFFGVAFMAFIVFPIAFALLQGFGLRGCPWQGQRKLQVSTLSF